MTPETQSPGKFGWYLLPGNRFHVAWTYLSLVAIDYHAVTVLAAMALGAPLFEFAANGLVITQWITIFLPPCGWPPIPM